MLKIDTHNGWFKGLGDAVCFAWIGSSLQAVGEDVEFFAHGWRAEVLRFFQQKVTMNRDGAMVPREGYETAVGQGDDRNYLEWIAGQCLPDPWPRIIGQWTRPRLNLDPMPRELGRKASARVLIFPECAWPTRTWPRAYFIELCLLMKKAGVDFAVVTPHRADDFTAFRCIYDQSLSYIAGAMQQAELVIGNDSGPAHLAGTIGTKTLAIHGPTTGRIFAHLPEVISLRKKSLDCAGCHCLPPFRESCWIGCHELYRTFPEDVFAEAMRILNPAATAISPSHSSTLRNQPQLSTQL